MRYPKEKLDEGARYLNFARDLVNPYGITFWSYDDPIFQRRGESLQGCEIKLDNRCTETGRLSIEVAEKSDSALPHWTASGICKVDNSWAYIQGNYKLVFVFSKKWLVRYYETKVPDVYESKGTIRKFYLPFQQALIACCFAIDREGKRIDPPCANHGLSDHVLDGFR